MLLTGNRLDQISIDTPKGIPLTLDLSDIRLGSGSARCAVQKDSGDDPDITNGILIYAQVERALRGITLRGGKGVGRVTMPGLDQPAGAFAINSAPREMIAKELTQTAKACGYEGGFLVTLSIPDGEKLAKRTFNPRLGIEGGLSIIGTTGIVEPMSHQAMIDTVRLNLRQLQATAARSVLLTPGNYGETFARDHLKLLMNNHVSCSNFIGDAIDIAAEFGFTQIFLIGHIGKMVKLGLGITNTHSSYGDGRMETLLACALEAGGDMILLNEISRSVTADAALAAIQKAGLTQKTMNALGNRIRFHLSRRVPDGVTIGYLCFTKIDLMDKILIQSDNADELMESLRNPL